MEIFLYARNGRLRISGIYNFEPFCFDRSINYTLNKHHKSHILVYANVVNVALELSETELELTPTHGTPVEAGIEVF